LGLINSEIEPDEVEVPLQFFEGATQRISVNAYERNREARQECLKHYGYRCSVCEFDFEKFYGSHGSKFIHVHHLKQLSEIGKKYQVNPILDLCPVCPNCHAMIHKGSKMLSIEALKQLIRK
jgi:5-methylcytosine-specific restriction enzyme A